MLSFICILAFRTDTDISQKRLNPGRERELQVWQPDTNAPPIAGVDDAFGTSSGDTAWDQFAVNENLFGVTGSFNEDDYTTKLDRNAAGFKEREIEAQRIATEILSVRISLCGPYHVPDYAMSHYLVGYNQ